MVDKETNSNICKTNSLCSFGGLNVGEDVGVMLDEVELDGARVV